MTGPSYTVFPAGDPGHPRPERATILTMAARISLALVIAGLSAAAVVPAASAQSGGGAAAAATPSRDPADDEAARQHFESGRAYFERARYEEAAREFGEAHRLSGRPALLLNLSRALEGAGDNAGAADALSRYVEQAPASPERGVEETRLGRLRAAAERDRQEALAHEQAAETEVDEDGAPDTGPEAEIDVGLTSDEAVASDDDGLSGMRWGAIGSGALGVVAGGASLITGLLASGIHGDLQDACASDGGCAPSRQGDIDSGQSLATVSTVLTGVALVAIAVGVVLWIAGD